MRENAKTMLHAAGMLLVLYVFWLLLSGHWSPFLLAAGAGSALAAVLVSRHMRIMDREGHPLHLVLRAAFTYWPWLMLEIVKSAWNVVCLILHPRLPISPTLARFRPSQRTDLGVVIHANSITLTPATICVEISRDELLIHALTAEGAAALTDSAMDRRVTQLERGR